MKTFYEKVKSFLKKLPAFFFKLACWLWLARVPVLVCVVLFRLPSSFKELTEGAFDCTGSRGNFVYVGLVLGVVVLTAWQTLRIIFDYGAERANLPVVLTMTEKAQAWKKRLSLVAVILAARPAGCKAVSVTSGPGFHFRDWLFLLLGASVAVPIFWFVWNVAARFGSKVGETFHARIQRMRAEIFEGYFDDEGGTVRLRVEHVRATVCAIISAIIFAVFAQMPAWHVPAFVYVGLLLIAACWALAGMAFFLDRFRIPLLGILVGWLALTGLLSGNDHEFHAEKMDQARLSAPRALLSASRTTRPVLVAVCGGGIHSGAWGSSVLVRLDELSRAASQGNDPLSRHIVCASGVSGGSYGLMHFVSGYGSNGEVPTNEYANILHRVVTSSLTPVVQGLVCSDLPRAFVPLNMSYDRGRAMEDAWMRSFGSADPTPTNRLSVWAEDTTALRRPVILFNATSVETGRQKVFATSRLDSEAAATNDIQNLDVSVVTAARLSATFPFVSPVARPDSGWGETNHFCDGGYFDNYGIVSLSRWLDDALEGGSAPTNVLVILIRYADDGAKTNAVEHGGLFQATAPIETLINVRSAAQRANGDLLLKTLREKWTGRNVNIKLATFEFDGDAALSWHLTTNDIAKLQAQVKAKVAGDSLSTVINYLSRAP